MLCHSSLLEELSLNSCKVKKKKVTENIYSLSLSSILEALSINSCKVKQKRKKTKKLLVQSLSLSSILEDTSHQP